MLLESFGFDNRAVRLLKSKVSLFWFVSLHQKTSVNSGSSNNCCTSFFAFSFYISGGLEMLVGECCLRSEGEVTKILGVIFLACCFLSFFSNTFTSSNADCLELSTYSCGPTSLFHCLAHLSAKMVIPSSASVVAPDLRRKCEVNFGKLLNKVSLSCTFMHIHWSTFFLQVEWTFILYIVIANEPHTVKLFIIIKHRKVFEESGLKLAWD